jgi:hypothetical protein
MPQIWNTKNTFTIRLHLKDKHKSQYVPDSSQIRITDGFVKVSQKAILERKIGGPPMESHRIELANQHSIDWIINHSQPFNLVEKDDFIQIL